MVTGSEHEVGVRVSLADSSVEVKRRREGVKVCLCRTGNSGADLGIGDAGLASLDGTAFRRAPNGKASRRTDGLVFAAGFEVPKSPSRPCSDVTRPGSSRYEMDPGLGYSIPVTLTGVDESVATMV